MALHRWFKFRSHRKELQLRFRLTMQSPEELARENIDKLPANCTWKDQGALGDHFQTTMISFLNSSFFFLTCAPSASFFFLLPSPAASLHNSSFCVLPLRVSMLRSLFFWIKTRMPQGPITRGDRQRFVRVQRSVWNALNSGECLRAIAARRFPMELPVLRN